MMSHVRHAAATFLKKTRLGCASTSVFLLVLALGLAANLPGDCNESAYRASLECEHGWPATYLVRSRAWDATDPVHKLGQVTMSVWAVTRDVEQVKPLAALANVLVILALALAASKAIQWRLMRWKWYQVSLLELLVVTTFAALFISYGLHLRRVADRRQRLIDEIQAIEGYLEYEPGGPDWLLALLGDPQLEGQFRPRLVRQAPWDSYVPKQNFVVDLTGFEPEKTPTAINYVAQLHDVRTLWLMTTKLTDSDMRAISRLSELEFLALDAAVVPAGSFRRLSSLRKLRALWLSDTAIGDFAALAHLTKLEALHLASTAVQDHHLGALEPLSELVVLDLSETAISDEGLRHLEQLPSLEDVGLSGTNVTQAGAFRLWQAGVKQIHVPSSIGCFELHERHRGKFAVLVDPQKPDENDAERQAPHQVIVPESGVCVVSATDIEASHWPRCASLRYGVFLPHHADVTPQPGRPMLFELPKRVDRGVVIHEYFVGTPEEWQNRPKVSPIDQRVAETVDRIVRTPERWPVERLGPNQQPEAPKQGQAD